MSNCGTAYYPVCGSDGVTYTNRGCMGVASRCEKKPDLQVVSIGDCQVQCPTLCPAVYSPVCGSDGFTYSNRCKLGVEQCQKKSDLEVVSIGDCQVRGKGVNKLIS